MHRFYLENEIGEEKKVILPKDEERQIKTVLRIKKGEKIVLFDGSGYDFISEFSGENFAEVEEKILNRREPERKVFLFQSILKKDNMEWIFQKATEAGIYEFIPILSSRSVKKDFNPIRAQKIIKEAAEQSGRACIPKIKEIMSFRDAVKFVQDERITGVITDPNSKKHIAESLKEARMGIFVGPEGGWDEEEISEAKESGFMAYSLGRLNLRAESAAIIASWSLVQ